MRNKEKSLTPVDENKIRLAQLSKGLAHPVRVEIVRMLDKKSPEARCVCGDIVNALPLAQSSVSQHLKTLKETGWIQGKIDGPCVCYCLIDGVIDEYTTLMNRTIGNKEGDILHEREGRQFTGHKNK